MESWFDISHLDSCQKLALTSPISLLVQKILAMFRNLAILSSRDGMFQLWQKLELSLIGSIISCFEVDTKVFRYSWVFQLIFSINPCVTCQKMENAILQRHREPASGRILNRYEESNEFPSVNCLTGEGRKRGKQTAAAK